MRFFCPHRTADFGWLLSKDLSLFSKTALVYTPAAKVNGKGSKSDKSASRSDAAPSANTAFSAHSHPPDFITFLRHHIAHDDNQRVT